MGLGGNRLRQKKKPDSKIGHQGVLYKMQPEMELGGNNMSSLSHGLKNCWMGWENKNQSKRHM